MNPITSSHLCCTPTHSNYINPRNKTYTLHHININSNNCLTHYHYVAKKLYTSRNLKRTARSIYDTTCVLKSFSHRCSFDHAIEDHPINKRVPQIHNSHLHTPCLRHAPGACKGTRFVYAYVMKKKTPITKPFREPLQDKDRKTMKKNRCEVAGQSWGKSMLSTSTWDATDM